MFKRFDIVDAIDDAADDQAQHFDLVCETGFGKDFELIQFCALETARIEAVLQSIQVPFRSAGSFFTV